MSFSPLKDGATRKGSSPLSPPVLYGLSAMAASMLHSVFVSFFIDYFVRLHMQGGSDSGSGSGASSTSSGGSSSGSDSNERSTGGLGAFVVGQVVYAVWNSLNDLGFGWFGDTHHEGHRKKEGVLDAALPPSSSSYPTPYHVYTAIKFNLRQLKQHQQSSSPSLDSSADSTTTSYNCIIGILLSRGCGDVGLLVASVGLTVYAILHRLCIVYPRGLLRVAVNRRRLSKIAIGGPLWAASFALLWIPIPLLRDISPSLELSIKLIVYDGFFSLTTVSFRALLVDIATSAKEREWCTMYAAGFQLTGSLGVVLASYLFESAALQQHEQPAVASSHTKDGSGAVALVLHDSSLWSFRLFCVVWAIVAAALFIISSSLARTETTLLRARKQHQPVAPHAQPNASTNNDLLQTQPNNDDIKLDEKSGAPEMNNSIANENGNDDNGIEAEEEEEPPLALIPFLRQTIQRRSMKAVLVVWNLQEYSCTFATNFFGMFLATVSAHDLSPTVRSSLLLLSFVIPHMVTIAIMPTVIPSYGKKAVISTLFLLRSLVGVALLMLAFVGLQPLTLTSSSSLVPTWTAWCFAGLLLSNRVLTEAVCRLQPLVLSDVCDEDTIEYNRPVSMAGAINGMVALVSRPSQSLAPVLSCLWLAHAGILSTPSSSVGEEASSLGAARHVMLLLATTILATTLVMFGVWRAWYGLHGANLKGIQHAMQLRTAPQNCDA